MATKLPDWIIAVDSLVAITSTDIANVLGDKPKTFAINWAHKTYSKYRPRELCVKIDGADTFDYLLSTVLFANWSEGFSVIRLVEYPVDDTSRNADIIDENNWEIYQTPTGYYLRFLECSPVSTEDIRVTYTALHTISEDANSTVFEIDIEAVQQLAASHFCNQLARYFSQTEDASLGADSADHKSKATEYSARAKELEKYFYDHLGIKKGSPIPASVNVDWDLPGSWMTGKVTHKSTYR